MTSAPTVARNGTKPHPRVVPLLGPKIDHDSLIFLRESLRSLAERLYPNEDDEYEVGSASLCKIVVREPEAGKKKAVA